MRLWDFLTGKIVMLLMRLTALMPLRLSQAVGKAIGTLSWRLDTRSAKVTRVNINECFPELPVEERSRLMRQSLCHTGMMLMETPAAWLGSLDRVLGWINSVKNEELLEAAIASEKGVLVILPHIGNWELVNVYLASKEGNCTGLYAPPGKAYLKELMSTIRSRFGNELVPTTVKGLATLIRRLEQGRIVVVLPDQVPASGEFAPFFGIDTLTDVLVTRLIKRVQPRVLCCVIRRLPDAKGFEISFSKPHPDIFASDKAVALAGLNLSVEACVHSAPDQYQWEYKRFKERPPGMKRLYNFNDSANTHH